MSLKDLRLAARLASSGYFSAAWSIATGTGAPPPNSDVIARPVIRASAYEEIMELAGLSRIADKVKPDSTFLFPQDAGDRPHLPHMIVSAEADTPEISVFICGNLLNASVVLKQDPVDGSWLVDDAAFSEEDPANPLVPAIYPVPVQEGVVGSEFLIPFLSIFAQAAERFTTDRISRAMECDIFDALKPIRDRMIALRHEGQNAAAPEPGSP